MYRFHTLLSHSQLVSVRKKLCDGSCSALLVMRTPARRYAKEHYNEKCPEVTPVRKSHKFLYGVVGATLMTGAAIVYAKNSKDARNWVENNFPLGNDIIALVYQENTTYLDFTLDKLEKAKVAIVGFLFGKEGITPMDFQQRAEQDLDKDAEVGFAPKTYPLPPPVLEPLYVEVIEDGQAEVAIEATLVQTERCEPVEPIKVFIPKEVKELEQEMHKHTRIAIDSLKASEKVTRDYNKALGRIIESAPGDKNVYTQLKGLRIERDKLAKDARESAAIARAAFASLEETIESGELIAPPENLTRTKRFIVEFREDLARAEKNFNEEMRKSDVMYKYWSQVEKARAMFQSELQAVFPGIDLCAPKLDVKDDVDLFIIFCANQIQYLQSSIAEMETVLEDKINKALECMDEKSLIEAKAQEMIMKDRRAKEIEFQKKALKLMADAHKKEKKELHKQFEIQENVAKQRLAKLEAEIMTKANRRASEEIEKERVKFKKELAAMAGRLKAIEQTLKQRADAEASARRSQSIWAAAEALLQATRRPAVTTKVNNELQALEKAGEKDKLVQTVLKGIPKEAKEIGIATEKALKDRFDVLERTATKVALVGKQGGSLPLYFMSWLQSKLMFQRFASIPQTELDNLPTDFTQLDTFDIIHRARYHMDRGDLGAALRYVNLLQGAPRAAAACWLQAARSHLEIRQAAETVMAHASLAGMLYS